MFPTATGSSGRSSISNSHDVQASGSWTSRASCGVRLRRTAPAPPSGQISPSAPSAGFSGSQLHNLILLPNRVWSPGPGRSGTLPEFGATPAKVAQARAACDADVASYRQRVLTGCQEVENDLAELNTLQDETLAQQRATAAAQKSAHVTRNQYQAGMNNYPDVATTENTSLSQQQSLLQLQSTQWVTSVQPVVALGGGWSSS
ncbi:TolC family protein [Erwinia amylovora]|uniref:TolC family protein n=1 Tax=Erwinia amylovora TaxID=552 RepID=UPI001443B5E0